MKVLDFITDSLTEPIEVVFQDEHYVAVFKPSGLMVHRGPRTLPTEPILLQVLRDQLNRYLYPIHRLDRPTAGLVLFGLTSESAARMAEQFASRAIAKHYQALVRGFFTGPLTVDRPLVDRADEWLNPSRRAEGIEADDGESVGQTAVTHFQCLHQWELDWPTEEFSTSRFSLLEIQPLTGRWHQIRRHLNHLAFPILGDHRHGDHRWNQRFFDRTGIYRMLLTAMRLDFRHPYTEESVSILVPRGEGFDRSLEILRQSGRGPYSEI